MEEPSMVLDTVPNASGSARRLKYVKAVRVRVLCDDFDHLANSPDHNHFWLAKENSIDDLVKIMYRLTSAISSLHSIGKAYHILIPNHIAVTDNNEVKLIMPFFMDYFNFPKLLIPYR
jgi:hypothetical protein